jgi:hypothetical protein
MRQTLMNDRSRREDNFLSDNTTHVLWRVAHDLRDIEDETGLKSYLQLRNDLCIYLFKYVCRQFTESVQSVYPEPDYIHYAVIAVIVGLCRKFGVCVGFVQNRRVYSHSQFLSGVNWGSVCISLQMPPKKKKSRGVRLGDRAGHAKERRPFSMDDCKQT